VSVAVYQIKEIREGSVIIEFTILPDLTANDDEEEEPRARLLAPIDLARRYNS
jgi:hypothetical protein